MIADLIWVKIIDSIAGYCFKIIFYYLASILLSSELKIIWGFMLLYALVLSNDRIITTVIVFTSRQKYD